MTALPPASERVRAEWCQRVEAEYRSSAITQHLTLWLTQVGASPDLILGGLRIAADEIDHADLSMETFLAAGGHGAPRLVRESLGLARDPRDPMEWDIARAALDGFCLGETVAVPLFRELREGCTVPVARQALDRILRDEVRHRDFGWTLLGWLLEDGPAELALRELVVRELPRCFARIRNSYAPAFARGYTALADDDRRWGLMPPARYAAVVERTFARDWSPRFAKLGIDAAAAWSESQQGLEEDRHGE